MPEMRKKQKIAKWASLRPMALKDENLWWFELFTKLKRFVWKSCWRTCFPETLSIDVLYSVPFPKVQTVV